MSKASAAHAQAPIDRNIRLPGENLTLEETLRVMDVVREMRAQRETAEEMFRHDDIRSRLRNKLLRTANMAGDRVTEAEIDAAIDQYMDTVNAYADPKPGLRNFVAHCWVWRGRIMMGLTAMATAAASFWFLFS